MHLRAELQEVEADFSSCDKLYKQTQHSQYPVFSCGDFSCFNEEIMVSSQYS